MFNTTNIAISNKKEVTITPEDIDLNIKRSNDASFFIEVNRDSKVYPALLRERPCVYEKKWYPWIEGTPVYPWNAIDKQMGGSYIQIEVPIKVLAIQYSGNNNFIFELQKLIQ